MISLLNRNNGMLELDMAMGPRDFAQSRLLPFLEHLLYGIMEKAADHRGIAADILLFHISTPFGNSLYHIIHLM